MTDLPPFELGYPRTVEDWHAAHERFFEQQIEPHTPIAATRFRVVERL